MTHIVSPPSPAIQFNGPCHFEFLTAQEAVDLKNTGVYIWGFARDKSSKQFIDMKAEKGFVGFKDSWQFIPYYVGKVESISMMDRLKQHTQVDCMNMSANKYIRMSSCYLHDFYSDPDFPIYDGRQARQRVGIMALPLGKIVYYNDAGFLNRTYGVNVQATRRKHYPFNKHVPSDVVDNLKQLVKDQNNFFFCYASINGSGPIRMAERVAFWSLKGKTVSRTNSFNSATRANLVITDNTTAGIFNVNANRLLAPTRQFVGYP